MHFRTALLTSSSPGSQLLHYSWPPGATQAMLLLSLHKNPFSQNTPLKQEIKARRLRRQWEEGRMAAQNHFQAWARV